MMKKRKTIPTCNSLAIYSSFQKNSWTQGFYVLKHVAKLCQSAHSHVDPAMLASTQGIKSITGVWAPKSVHGSSPKETMPSISKFPFLTAPTDEPESPPQVIPASAWAGSGLTHIPVNLRSPHSASLSLTVVLPWNKNMCWAWKWKLSYFVYSCPLQYWTNGPSLSNTPTHDGQDVIQDRSHCWFANRLHSVR